MTAGSGDVRAGGAYVEVYTKDKSKADIDKAAKNLRVYGDAAKSASIQLAKMSAVASAPFVAGAKVFADYQYQLAQVGTMLDEPTQHLGEYGAEVRTLAIEMGEATGTLTKGLYDILSASIPASQALDVLAVSAKAARAGLSDTGTAADAITTILNSYSLGADKAASVSDLLFSIVKRGKTTFVELAPAIGRVTSIASVAGVSLEELGAMLTTMTRAGVRTEHAVTGLQAVITTFLNPTDEASDLAKALGFEMSSATLKAEGLEGVMRKLMNLPPDALSAIFPNVRALRGMAPAMKNLKGFQYDLEVMANRAGATDKAYENFADTLTLLGGQVKQAWVAVADVVGKAIYKDVEALGKAIKSIASDVTVWISQNKNLVRGMAAMVMTAGAASVALLAMSVSFKGLAAAITITQKLTTAFQLFAIALQASVAKAMILFNASLFNVTVNAGKFMTVVTSLTAALKGLGATAIAFKGIGLAGSVTALGVSMKALALSIAPALAALSDLTIAAAPFVIAIGAVGAAVYKAWGYFEDLSAIKQAQAETASLTLNTYRLNQEIDKLDKESGRGKYATYESSVKYVDDMVKALIKEGKTEDEIKAALEEEIKYREKLVDLGEWTPKSPLSKEAFEGEQFDSAMISSVARGAVDKSLDAWKEYAAEVKKIEDEKNQSFKEFQAKALASQKENIEKQKANLKDFQKWQEDQAAEKAKSTYEEHFMAALDIDPEGALMEVSGKYADALEKAGKTIERAQESLMLAVTNPYEWESSANKDVEQAKAAQQEVNLTRQLVRTASQALAQAKAAAASDLDEFLVGRERLLKQRTEAEENKQFRESVREDPMKAYIVASQQLAQAKAEAVNAANKAESFLEKANATGTKPDMDAARLAVSESNEAERRLSTIMNQVDEAKSASDRMRNIEMPTIGTFVGARANQIASGLDPVQVGIWKEAKEQTALSQDILDAIRDVNLGYAP